MIARQAVNMDYTWIDVSNVVQATQYLLRMDSSAVQEKYSNKIAPYILTLHSALHHCPFTDDVANTKTSLIDQLERHLQSLISYMQQSCQCWSHKRSEN